LRVQTPAVQRGPLAVGALDQVRDEDVRVKLRIAGAGRPMPEGRPDQSVSGKDLSPAAAAPDHRDLPL
jgi:hypothetical protein